MEISLAIKDVVRSSIKIAINIVRNRLITCYGSPELIYGSLDTEKEG